ncbi:YcxB family protein [Micromonospora halotolerans]|uniref:YcxB family protein n=1 Tax=Micromonospora halotolerans TaxID=709879 RepID=A0ABY9ZZ45_9ACTN|nr:YcxB family protein [Micromonospora halotolerans]WNM40584.1 YcxB family protein [Micromonospora halotolerans]
MSITFTTEPNRRLLGFALRRAFRRALMSYWICAGVMALLALLAWYAGDTAGVVAGSAGAVALALVAWWAGHRTVSMNWKLYGRPIVWSVGDEGVRYDGELVDCLVRWPAVERVEPVPYHLIFRIGRYQVLPARVDGLDADQRDELLAFLHARGLLGRSPEEATRRIAPVG